jgi:hypothetical protein
MKLLVRALVALAPIGLALVGPAVLVWLACIGRLDALCGGIALMFVIPIAITVLMLPAGICLGSSGWCMNRRLRIPGMALLVFGAALSSAAYATLGAFMGAVYSAATAAGGGRWPMVVWMLLVGMPPLIHMSESSNGDDGPDPMNGTYALGLLMQLVLLAAGVSRVASLVSFGVVMLLGCMLNLWVTLHDLAEDRAWSASPRTSARGGAWS